MPLAIEVAEKRELGGRRDWLRVNPASLGAGVKEPAHWSGPRVIRWAEVETPESFHAKIDEAA